MRETIVQFRNELLKLGYQYILKPILFCFPPEKVHDQFIRLGRFLSRYTPVRWVTSMCFGYKNTHLKQSYFDLTFPNPIGLSAGFDKNADIPEIFEYVGFGFAEFGSITARAYEGNPGTRLWRIPEKKSLRVYYGLKNIGVDEIAPRIKKAKVSIPLGISIAKTNCQATTGVKGGIEDYLYSLKACEAIGAGDYYTLNISCPNAHGGESFLDPEHLEKLLERVCTLKIAKPIFVKIASSIPDQQLHQIIDICQKCHISGFIATNLKKNPGEKGGLSGGEVRDLSDDLVERIYSYTQGKAFIIGVGGIFTPEDAYEKIKRGASLLQMITGMIYEGPQNVSHINQGLVKLLQRDGYTNISQAIGSGVDLRK
ncbi:quinone-dependent dihydroorotate dehydrogenase [Candidatus Nomurabacteria bacterium]|nr:quinone-dependent dihydroorotate dehydrogenase [Candidatus Nomurabacteria bacterium]